VLPTGTKGCFLSRLPDPGQKGTPFCPGLTFPVEKPEQKEFPNRCYQPGQKGDFYPGCGLAFPVGKPGQKGFPNRDNIDVL